MIMSTSEGDHTVNTKFGLKSEFQDTLFLLQSGGRASISFT